MNSSICKASESYGSIVPNQCVRITYTCSKRREIEKFNRACQWEFLTCRNGELQAPRGRSGCKMRDRPRLSIGERGDSVYT
jgi:hypothetical protein